MGDNVYLVDTHCLLWFLDESVNISNKAVSEMQSISNVVFFSQISLFEIAIKQKIGKLPNVIVELNDIYCQAIESGFSYLPIKNQHIFSYQKIPLLPNHRDPFDRLLLATAYHENARIISADANFCLYSDWVGVVW